MMKTPKDDFFFIITLFKIPQNYHAIAICHYKCCLATSAWKEVICADCELAVYSSIFPVETVYFFIEEGWKKTNMVLVSNLCLSTAAFTESACLAHSSIIRITKMINWCKISHC